MKRTSPPKTQKKSTLPSVALVGLGYWGRNILKTLASLEPKELVIFDEDPSRLNQAKGLTPLARAVDSMDAILQDSSIEAVCIATPVELHAKHVITCLKHGKTVFVEKPLCGSTKEALLISKASKRYKKDVMVGHIYVHHPAITMMKDWIQKKKLGDLHWIRSTRCSLGPRVREDVDVLWDYAIHDVYLIPFLLDRSISRVRVDGRPCLKSARADWVEFSMEFQKTACVMHGFVSWLNPFKERNLMVVGSKGIAVFDELKSPCLTFYRCGYRKASGIDKWGNVDLELFDEGKEEWDLDSSATLRSELHHFLTSIRSGHPRASLEDGIRTLDVLEKMSKSLKKEGCWVTL
jgi:UDP-2-acetamido-3-amino-2,3-dideoxy-glucuronate N-acetyltransferase